MADVRDDAIRRIRQLPVEQQEAAADMLEAFAREHRAGVYVLSDEEDRLIDEAIRGLDRGRHASDAEVEAVFARYRR